MNKLDSEAALVMVTKILHEVTKKEKALVLYEKEGISCGIHFLSVTYIKTNI